MAKAPAKIESQEEEQVEQQETEQQELLASPEEVIEEEPEPDDASITLQKQIEALKRSEEIQRNRAEQFRLDAEKANQRIREQGTEVANVRKEAIQSQLDAVSAALNAAQNEAESAKRDIKTAINNGDPDSQAEAYERLATARANISKLEDGKFDLETRIKNPPKEEETPQQNNGIPARIQTWLNKHPEYLTDRRKNDKIRSLHWDVIEEGHNFDSDGYIESMETKLGLRQAEEEDESVIVRQPQQRNSIVSAPVSREAPSTPNNDRGGPIKLTTAQREAARIAGVSEKVYAENLQRITKMKANGSYEAKGG